MNNASSQDNSTIDSDAVYQFLTSFHDSLCQQLSQLDGGAVFLDDQWQRDEGGGGLTRILTDGALFEKAGVAFSRVNGTALPPSAAFAVLQSVANNFYPAYAPIVERRRHMPYSQRERDFQLYRRGRYVEFNLVFDRGTLFGLQSGGRTESILMSLPPHVSWHYNYEPEPGSPEAELTEKYLPARDWLASNS